MKFTGISQSRLVDFSFFFQAEDGIRDYKVTGVQTCALPISLYRRPRDLVAAGYKPGSTAFPNKGAQIGRRDQKNQLVPYYDRGAIEAGALDGQKLEICWLKDPFDLLTIQIEGSARVILEDGTPLRISYDSHNGYRYSSIERV